MSDQAEPITSSSEPQTTVVVNDKTPSAPAPKAPAPKAPSPKAPSQSAPGPKTPADPPATQPATTADPAASGSPDPVTPDPATPETATPVTREVTREVTTATVVEVKESSSSSCSTSCSTTPTPITSASDTSSESAPPPPTSTLSPTPATMPVPTSSPTAAPAPLPTGPPVVSVPPMAPVVPPMATSYEVTNGHMMAAGDAMVTNGVVMDQSSMAAAQNGTYIMQSQPQMMPSRPNRGAPAPLHTPGAQRGHSPHRYSPPGPGSRGNSPPDQANPPSQHVVLVHINPGETFSVRVGDQIQHIQGPATVRMVSNNGPPLPMPMQVPPGHMVQQIVDENGILTHVILSPQPPGMAPAPPMTVGYYGGPNSPPQQVYSPYGPQYPYPSQYTPHHSHAPPPSHIHHVGPPPPPPPHIHGTPPPPQCNNHSPHTPQQGHPAPGGPGGPPSHHNHHIDDRAVQQKRRLQEKLRTPRNKEPVYYSSHSSPRRPAKTKPPGESCQRMKGSVNGSVRTADHSSSSSADGQELEEERRSIRSILSSMTAPKVSQVDARSAFIQLTPPDCGGTDYVIHPTEFKYELLLSEKTADYKMVYSGDAPEITLQDLKPAMEYHLKVCSILDDLKGEQTSAVTFRTSPCEPDLPLPPELSTRTKTSLMLKWNAAVHNGSKVTGYVLEYDQGRGSGFVEVYNGVQRQYKVTKLQASTGYTFRLAATNAYGHSGYSEQVCFYTSGSAPSQPDPPMLSDQFVNALTISWIKRPNDDEFILQMEDEVTGHGFLTVYNGPYLSHKIETLRRNTEYKFRLCANNEEGGSKWSDIVNYRTLPDRPGPPNKPTLKGKVHATTARIMWECPRDTGGADISKYHLELGDTRGFELVFEGVDREFTVERLLPGHEYKVRVSCSSVGGQSDWSDCLKIQAQAVCPGACQSPKLQGKPKATTLHLRWNYPDYDGGSTVSEYEVLMTLSDNTTLSVFRGHALDCVVAGLNPGRSYLYQVRASSKAGSGPWSEPLEVVSGAGVPDPPKAPGVTCKSAAIALITWDEPVNNGATITDYRLEWQARPEAEFIQLYAGPACSFEVRGLTPNTTYAFRVQACNSAGAGPFSPGSSVLTPASSPGPVTHLLGDPTADTIALSWQEPANHGSEIVAYNIDLGEKHLISTPNILTHVIEDLTPETAYKIRVQAVNSIGVGAFSVPIKVTTRALPPDPPRLECVSITHNSLKLKWGDGKNPDHLQYTFSMKRENSSSFQLVYQGGLQTHKVNRLSELTEYHFRASASNEAGEGPHSRVYSFKTTKAPPAAVRPPKVSEVGLDSCLVEWPACKPLGTDSIIYCLQLLNSHARDHEYKQIYRGPETSYRLMGISARTEYQVRVSAVRVCSDGCPDLSGAFSPGVSFVTMAPKASPAVMGGAVVKTTSEPRQLSDSHWALIILLGFALFAAVVAMLAQQVIAYTSSTPGSNTTQ